MRGRDVVGLVFVGVLLTLGVGGYLLWELQGDSSQSPTVAQSADQTSETPATIAPQQSNTPQQNQQSPLQVQGSTSVNLHNSQSSTQQQTTPQAPTQPVLPEPTQFTEYEQYAADGNLLYIDEVVGAGDEAVAGARVAMLYRGWLTDGQLFDQTKPDAEGVIQPFVFDLGAGQVIQGWDQGVAGMKVGGKRRLVIPHEFGYGPNGQGPIPPNAMLIFDVELVGVAPQDDGAQ